MIHERDMTPAHTIKAMSIILLATAFYVFEFVLQMSPAVMTHELMASFGLTALGVSTLSAFFFYAYAPMQMPGGLLYDRFGPRLVLTFAAVICTIGALLFAEEHNYWAAAFGRFLMGIGGACSFVGVLVIATRWFPPRFFALIAGLLQLLGSVASIVGQVPLAIVVKHIGWRDTIFSVFLVGVVLVVLLPLVIRNYPKNTVLPKHPKVGRGEWKKLKTIFTRPQTFIMALYSFFAWMPMTVFGALWGIDFLSERYGISITYGASLMAVLWIGVGLGSPFFGWLSERMGQRRIPLYLPAILGMIGAAVLVYVPMTITGAIIALFLFGVGASGQSLIFAVVRDNNAHHTVGTAMGFNNFAVVVGGATCQPLVGYLIVLGWNGAMVDGVSYYNVATFQKAFLLLPISFLLCALFGRFWVKETHCKPVEGT